MNYLEIISGPAIGAVIGYFTNYIAVKMLFRPYKPVKIGKWTLPFTPGVIPRRKKDLANAIGNAIENNLFGKDDVQSIFASESMKNAVADGVWAEIESFLASGITAGEACDSLTGEGASAVMGEKLTGIITRRTAAKLEEMNLGQTIAEMAGLAVAERVQGTMLAMFVGPDMINSILAPFENGVNEYIRNEGMAQISEFAAGEIDGFLKKPVGEIIVPDDEMKARVQAKIGEIYAGFMSGNSEKLTSGFNTGKIVAEKINAMDVADFEKLVMSVMKHELGMIVNLGALIGLVIGVLNIFL